MCLRSPSRCRTTGLPKWHGLTNQYEQLSGYGGLGVGRGQVRSSNRTHENRFRHDGRESLGASSTTSGGSRLGRFLRMRDGNAQGDGGGGKHLREQNNQLQQLQQQNDQQPRLISKLESDLKREIEKSKESRQSTHKMIREWGKSHAYRANTF